MINRGLGPRTLEQEFLLHRLFSCLGINHMYPLEHDALFAAIRSNSFKR